MSMYGKNHYNIVKVISLQLIKINLKNIISLSSLLKNFSTVSLYIFQDSKLTLYTFLDIMFIFRKYLLLLGNISEKCLPIPYLYAY